MMRFFLSLHLIQPPFATGSNKSVSQNDSVSTAAAAAAAAAKAYHSDS